MHHESLDVSITGNSTNPKRFQHPVAGTYKKECIEQGKKFFSVASGGGTGRTLHPDHMGLIGMGNNMFDRWVEGGLLDVLKDAGVGSKAFVPFAKGY